MVEEYLEISLSPFVFFLMKGKRKWEGREGNILVEPTAGLLYYLRQSLLFKRLPVSVNAWVPVYI